MHLATLVWGSFEHIKHPSAIESINLRGILFLSINYESPGPVPQQHPISMYYGSSDFWQNNSPQSLRARSTDKTPLLALHATYDPVEELQRIVSQL